VLFVARRNTAKADIGTGMELDVITAVVLGGTSIFGGHGRIPGTLLGVLLIHETREFVSWRWNNDELIFVVTGVLLIASVVIMFGLFLYTQIETHRAHKKLKEMTKAGKAIDRELQTSSLPKFFQRIPLAPIVRCRTARVIVSMWVIVLVGMVTGVLAGFLGVGGGFIRVPALVYLVGSSTHVAVGTDLVEIVFSGGYGALRHSMEGHVDMMAVVFMLSGALFGAQVGSIATAYVRGPAIRFVLSYSLILATCGAALRLAYVLTGQSVELLSLLAVMLTLGEMIFLCLFIMCLVVFAYRARHGGWVPDWAAPLLTPPDDEAAPVVPATADAGGSS